MNSGADKEVHSVEKGLVAELDRPVEGGDDPLKIHEYFRRNSALWQTLERVRGVAEETSCEMGPDVVGRGSKTS